MKKHKAILAYSVILVLFTAYVIMDTFFITRVYKDESGTAAQEHTADIVLPGSGDDESTQADILGNSNSEDSGNMHDGSSESGSHEHSGRGPGGSLPGTRSKLKSPGTSEQADTSDTSDAADTADSNSSSDTYNDGNIQVSLSTYRQNDTTIYVADVRVASPQYLKTAFAQDAYGRNVTEKTSVTAQNAGAVLAVNGDYYGAQEKGYVIRNGELYRDTALSGQEDLVIYSDGSFGIINESEVTAQELMSAGAQQVLSFGPALVTDGSIAVSENEEVGRATASNPRTAIGIIDENHYVFVVSDGRTEESAGLSLYELAQYMRSLGAETAYNLDGGGSSTMYFNGRVVNNTTGGMGNSERSVSDIVYIGY